MDSPLPRRMMPVLLAICCIAGLGCSPQPVMIVRHQQSYNAALKNAVKTCRPARAFIRLYPDSIRWFEYYLPGSGSTALHVKTALHERYVLSLHMPVGLDQKRERAVNCGVPQFLLQEVVDISADGREIRYNTAIQPQLSVEDWQRLVTAGGDFSVLGIELKTNAPVPGFRKAWNEDPYSM